MRVNHTISNAENSNYNILHKISDYNSITRKKMKKNMNKITK